MFGERLQVRRSHRLPDWARVYVCMLPNRTLSAIPAWMSDRECCLHCELSSTPQVSLEAREELRTLLAQLPGDTDHDPHRKNIGSDGCAEGWGREGKMPNSNWV
jgi:hypothetical protein